MTTRRSDVGAVSGLERPCCLCGTRFVPLRRAHRFCSDGCRAEAALLVRVLQGESWRYPSLPARLAASSGAAWTPLARMLTTLDRMREERARRRAAGEIGPRERGALAVVRSRSAAATSTLADPGGADVSE
jgi:hypothetical protein